jgi:triosephosphate isomerase
MRRCLVVGNWKMHGTKAVVDNLVAGLRNEMNIDGRADVAVCPPFVFIPQVTMALAGIGIACGAQDISEQAGVGARTGEVSGMMLAEQGCQYAIVGHSERRSFHGETDVRVSAKFSAAMDAGLTPILCVGESLDQRESGQALETVAAQVNVVLSDVGIDAFSGAVVAYEPVWAIGTGKTASPEQAQEVHAHIRQVLSEAGSEVAEQVQILYGGSVNAGNAAALFAKKDIDGALVGGASLKIDEFAAIYTAGG